MGGTDDPRPPAGDAEPSRADAPVTPDASTPPVLPDALTGAGDADEVPVTTGDADDVPATTGAGPRAGRSGRVSSAGAIIALLLGLLGFALVVQLRSNATDPELATARPEDLVRILSDLDSRSDRLRQEIASLEASQRQLASGAQGQAAAVEEARRRADELGILAGTLPAQGRGLELTFTAGSEALPASTLLDAVEELRGAGAEAMQIAGADGRPVRIVASTYFADAKGGLTVDGVRLTGPYRLVVIGDPQTMHTALNIPGGVVDTVHQRGGNVIVQESDVVGVTALHQVAAPRYARPVS
ncbi:DUF881 domain-containing protein [Planosporangium sp. 12N6]|uniref:DUF881 domain-containing protein n=1 Tax=Planosporangium spinosum TaxID=3402278 RepID=UPI003CF780D0